MYAAHIDIFNTLPPYKVICCIQTYGIVTHHLAYKTKKKIFLKYSSKHLRILHFRIP